MVGPAAQSSYPISISDNNRIVVTDAEGNQKKYRLKVSSKKTGELSLTSDQERKIAEIMVKILTEAGLNNASVDLTAASLKGRKVIYKGKETDAQPTETTYKKFQDIIEPIKSQALKTAEPAKEAIREAAPPPETEQKTKKSLKERVKDLAKTRELSMPLNHALTDTVKEIKEIFKLKAPEGAKTLAEISKVLDQVAADKGGKLRFVNGAVVYANTGFVKALQGGSNSVNALNYVLQKVAERIEAKDLSDEEKVFAGNILARISESPWAQVAMKKNAKTKNAKQTKENEKAPQKEKSLTEIYTQTKERLQEINSIAKNFSTAPKLFADIVASKETREEFFLGYRNIFSGSKYKMENDKDFAKVQAAKTLEMLHFLRDQAVASKNHKALLGLIQEWLQNDKFNGTDYANPEVVQYLKFILQGAPVGLLDQEATVNTLLDKKIESQKASKVVDESKAELSEKWKANVLAIKNGSIKPEEYNEFVRQFAHDLGEISINRFTRLNPNELDPGPVGPNYAALTRYFNNLSNFAAREMLSPIEGVLPFDSAQRMRLFFNDVQKALIQNQKYDAAIALESVANKYQVSRLKLEQNLSPGVLAQNINPNTNRTVYNELVAKGQGNKMVPYIGIQRSIIVGLEEGNLAKKELHGEVRFNRFKMQKIAEQKNTVVKAQNGLTQQEMKKLNYSELNKLLDMDDKKNETLLEQEIDRFSYNILPRGMTTQSTAAVK